MLRNLKMIIIPVVSLFSMVGILLLSGCVDSGIENSSQEILDQTTKQSEEESEQINDRILAKEAYELIQEISDYHLIDLRTPEEFASEHLPNAINIYIQSETFLDEIDDLDKDKTTMAYYRPSGLPMPMGFQRPNETMTLTVEAINLFEEIGFREAYIVKGGLIAWKFEGLPTITEEKPASNPTEEEFYVDSINAEEAYALMQNRTDYIIVDTRTPGEFANEHLPGATNIDYESEDFGVELDKLDKQKLYFFYHRPYGICSFQYCPTSEDLTATLDMTQTFRELKFRETHFIQGGLIAWKFEGLPTVRS